MDIITLFTIIISILTAIGLIVTLFFNAKIKNISLYWVVCLAGALIALLINVKYIGVILGALIENSSINPVKILVFFICMTILSIVLDNLHFFNYLANKCAGMAKNSQFKLFLIFYCLVSILTIFTSNDIVILAFVPFICHFCKNTNINPAPYVFSTFVAANTWSMLLVIGNPTNVYVSSFMGIDFFTYFLKMAIPTFVCGVISFLVLFILFRKQLKETIKPKEVENININKPLVFVNAIFLLSCTALLAVSSYIGLEMWYIALGFVIVELIVNIIICAIKKQDKKYIVEAVKRAPWTFVPFLLSMFIIIMCLDVNGITKAVATLFDKSNPIITYGVSSFLFSNIINNIPMTALFSSILAYGSSNMMAAYATIIGSNLGAMLTPIGALAGIMFLNILKEKGVNFSIKSFIKYGVIVSVISLTVSLFLICLI